jgi:hypothetical protein
LFTLRYVNTNSCAKLALVTPNSLFNAAVKISASIVDCPRNFIGDSMTNDHKRDLIHYSSKKRNSCSSISIKPQEKIRAIKGKFSC